MPPPRTSGLRPPPLILAPNGPRLKKPLATRVKDGRDLTAKATAAALVATVPFVYRLYRTVRESNAPAWRWWSRNDAHAAASRSTAYAAVSPLSPRLGGRRRPPDLLTRQLANLRIQL